MLRVHVYAVGRRFLVPTLVQTNAGFWLEVEPVHSTQSLDSLELAAVLVSARIAGNPIIGSPSREGMPQPVVAKAAGARSQRDLQRKASFWTVRLDEGGVILVRHRVRSDGRGWEEDAHSERRLPGEALALAAKEIAEAADQQA
jgi:hypothetical protein